MIVSLEEMKQYLRVDYEDDDALIRGLMLGAVKICMDVMRTDNVDDVEKCENGKVAVMYATAYFYEHREEADHHALMMTLRALLFGDRQEGF
ncbi:head-tail connector protein [uncultured Clostridium sp.]|uniref:head-tail connector protein n=1 Tax=uncultured Clostridium sp. TaxID=59620 RepID=UPI00260047BD|nr:head-tail connector protein [uncultured Clostridium sp.]